MMVEDILDGDISLAKQVIQDAGYDPDVAIAETQDFIQNLQRFYSHTEQNDRQSGEQRADDFIGNADFTLSVVIPSRISVLHLNKTTESHFERVEFCSGGSSSPHCAQTVVEVIKFYFESNQNFKISVDEQLNECCN